MVAPFDFMEQAKRLIRFNTATWESNADCAVAVGQLLRAIGAQVSYQEERSEGKLFLNVVGLFGEGKRPLLLTTHLDTVDAGDRRLWTKTGGDPCRLTLRRGILYGLGVADTKLDILCKLSALSRLPLSDLKRTVLLLGTYGEESGLRGAARFCQGEFPKPQMALVGEPTELVVVNRHKSILVVELLLKSRGIYRPSEKGWAYEATFQGEAAHSSTPQLGRNALEAGCAFIERLAKHHKKLSIFSWEAGTAANVVPASCSISFSLGPGPAVKFPHSSHHRVKAKPLAAGWHPTFSWENLLFIREVVAGLLPSEVTWSMTQLRHMQEGWVLTFDARAFPGEMPGRFLKQLEGKLWKRWGPPGPTWQLRVERDNPALDLEKNAPLVKLCTAALRAIRHPASIATKAGCSEAGLYAKVGIPSVVIGPGKSVGNIHQPNEWVPVSQLKAAIRFYEAFLKKLGTY